MSMSPRRRPSAAVTALTTYTTLLAEEEAPAPAPAAAVPRYWEGTIGVEGTVTGDGRLIEAGALRWDTPFPLRFVLSDVGAHDGAQVSGTAREVWREGALIRARGTFDMGGEAGIEAFRQVDEKLSRGVSMDLDDVSFEVRVARELIEDTDVDTEETPVPQDEEDEEGRVTVVKIDGDDEVMVTTDARIRAATIVAVPAFIEATIDVAAEGGEDEDNEEPEDNTDEEDDPEEMFTSESDALIASAAPAAPPRGWFNNPDLEGPTPLTITAEGRIYGHLAEWGVCHLSHTMNGQCLEAPASSAAYAYFRTGAVLCSDDSEVAVGRITLGTDHAGYSLSPHEVDYHYDNSGSVAAYVAAGEDAHGIWLAGALKPEVTPEQVRTLRGSPLSGDWRRVGANLELLAVLAVNGPGFPVPRPAGLVASGQMRALVASSGMLPPRTVAKPGTEGALSTEDLRYLKRLANRERASSVTEMATRVAATKRAANERKVRAFTARRGHVHGKTWN